MPFQKIEPYSGPRLNGVRIGRAGKKNNAPVNIRIGFELANQTGLIPGARVDVFLGDGSDSGTLGLKATTSLTARKIGRPNKETKTSTIRLSQKSIGAVAPTKSFAPVFRIEDGMLVIDIHQIMTSKLSAAA